MVSTNRAKLNDLFNFQGIRKRIIIAPDYSENDERLIFKTTEDESKKYSNEYKELDTIEQQFESYVRPTITRKQWIENRKHQRQEIDRLGDIIYFYDHKPHLTEFEKRIYKRLTKRDQCSQTDVEVQIENHPNRKQNRVPKIRLPTPLAMHKVEEFLYNNHWRLLDLFRTLDQEKNWALVKEDFMRLAKQEQINITEAQAEELITCFCREAGVPLNYKKFARGRAMYKRNIRDSAKTSSSFDTQLESVPSTPSSNHLQLPSIEITREYPIGGFASSNSQSTKPSDVKIKRTSVSTLRTDSQLSAY